MKEKKYDLEDRFVSLAADIVLFCNDLPNDMTGNYYGNQLLRSAGSAALNFGEAQGTNTIKDSINKLSLSLKELKESRVNLKILKKVNIGKVNKIDSLLDEFEQLIKNTATIIKNKKLK